MLDIRFATAVQSKRKNNWKAHLVVSSENQPKRMTLTDTLLMKQI